MSDANLRTYLNDLRDNILLSFKPKLNQDPALTTVQKAHLGQKLGKYMDDQIRRLTLIRMQNLHNNANTPVLAK